jgi:hypothetical protein
VSNPLVELVEKAAKARGETTVPRDYIVEALERLQCGELQVERYPGGAPSLKGVYEIANRLYTEQKTI